ncbi:hypothetical protein SAMD00079811_33160 [Scytonema sp. HK-05]|nr:hypothetical protein SAMD00079811_33160 [Scytonema sp. HK-05]
MQTGVKVAFERRKTQRVLDFVGFRLTQTPALQEGNPPAALAPQPTVICKSKETFNSTPARSPVYARRAVWETALPLMQVGAKSLRLVGA